MNSTPILPAIDAEATKVHSALGVTTERAKELNTLILSALKESIITEYNRVGIDQGKWLQLMQPHVFTPAEAFLIGYNMRKYTHAIESNPIFQLLSKVGSALREETHRGSTNGMAN